MSAPRPFPELPVAARWFESRVLAPGLTVIVEPHVHELERANLFLVEGSERDLILDTGMGIVPLAPYLDTLRAFPDKELVCVSSHTHVDHIGGVHEFDVRLVHPAEADEMANPSGIDSLFTEDIPISLRETFLRAGYAPLDTLLIDALPYAGYDPSSYRLHGAPPTGTLEEGDTLELGDRTYRVLHLPGHSPGGIGLFEERTGVLFAADAVYDGPLIHEGPGMSLKDYVATLERLRTLDVDVVHGGHDPSFSRARLHEIVDRYLAIWSEAGTITGVDSSP